MSALAAAIEEACGAGSVTAASLSLRGIGRDDLDVAYGLADPLHGTPATPDTLFHIGSVTKALTAELIHDQIADNRFTLDTPITEAAPELRRIGGLAGRTVTIGHLLSHTSGIDGDILFDAGEGDDVLRRFISRIDTFDFLFEPDTGFSYANIGYGLLGRIAESAAGVPYRRMLNTSLRERHGIRNFAVTAEERAAAPLAQAYDGDQPELLGPYSNVASGTILVMTMGDLAHWGLRQRSDRIMHQMAVQTPFALRYRGWGHGFMIFAGEDEAPVFGHDGGTAGTSTFLRILPEASASWAFAATGPGALSLYRKIEPALFDLVGQRAPRHPQPGGGPPPASLERYAGHYARHKMTFDLSCSREALLLKVGGDYASDVLDGAVLVPLTDRVFEARLPKAGNAAIWAAFDDFSDNGAPRLFFVTERMAARQ
ncbi:MAG: beta-lactamase family protein [Sphingosinicella sp.]|nr:beta-lactamase family protein [Sphingosinicella sp.]